MSKPIPKSPFYVINDFVSPQLCEDMVDQLNLTTPSFDKDGVAQPFIITDEVNESVLYPRMMTVVPTLEQYYGIKYKGSERVQFEWYTDGASCAPHAENSEFLRQKWLRTRSRDLTGVLFFSDYQDNTDFDGEFEVYGGKLEFPQHGFGFTPQRGTLVIFPSDPHFINLTTSCLVGSLVQARFQIASETPFLYQPTGFPGVYTDWFKNA